MVTIVNQMVVARDIFSVSESALRLRLRGTTPCPVHSRCGATIERLAPMAQVRPAV